MSRLSRPLLLSLLLYGLVAAGLITRQAGFLALALPLLLYLGLALLARPAEPKLAANRRLSAERAGPDEPVEVTLNVTNRGAGLAELYLVDEQPPGLSVTGGETSLLTPLGAGETITLRYSVQAGRGLYRFGPVQATARSPLGLFPRQSELTAPGQFLVLPELIRLRRVAIRPPRTGVYAGQIPARQGGPGVEFFGVRAYRPGDPPGRLNQRASARHPRQLFVNQFEQERVVDVGLILDARLQSDARRGPEALFESSVQAAAALAAAFIEGGNRVGLLIYGRSLEWTFPGYGKMQRERILRALAQARQGGGKIFEKLEHLPTRLFPARSQLVFVSPLLPQDPDNLLRLRARGYELLVISPDPIAFEAAALPQTQTVALARRIAQVERDFILRQLRQARIQVVDWPVDVPFQQAAQAALSRLPFRR